MSRALVVTLVAALVAVGAAAANHLDPKKQIRPADQARARAMVVRASDLPAGYRVQRTSGLEPHLTCRALDESDLTVTGVARSPYRALDYRIVGSAAAVYRTEAEARRAWARSTSAAGMRCIRTAFTTSLGERLEVSLSPLAFPRVARARAAFRMTIGSQASTEKVYVDYVLLGHGRAQAALVFASAIAPFASADEVAVARAVGARMAAAMRRG